MMWREQAVVVVEVTWQWSGSLFIVAHSRWSRLKGRGGAGVMKFQTTVAWPNMGTRHGLDDDGGGVNEVERVDYSRYVTQVTVGL